jgi:hypothetical protein
MMNFHFLSRNQRSSTLDPRRLFESRYSTSIQKVRRTIRAPWRRAHLLTPAKVFSRNRPRSCSFSTCSSKDFPIAAMARRLFIASAATILNQPFRSWGNYRGPSCTPFWRIALRWIITTRAIPFILAFTRISANQGITARNTRNK